MEKLIDNKDVEEIDETPVQAADSDRYVNYIPHLCVARFDKVSSQVRPVFDASARNSQGLGLNENLESVPKTQRNLSHLNMHIRMKPVVLLCDIKRMYYSILYDPTSEPRTKLKDNRDAFRFLWHKDPSEPPTVYTSEKC